MLEPGDFIYIYRNQWYMLFARAIKHFTNGPAHVAIVHKVDGRFVYLAESKVIGGVQLSKVPLHTIRSSKQTTFEILRKPEGVLYDPAKIENLIAFTLDSERDYGYLNMLREVRQIDKLLTKLGVKRNRETYCSNFATRALNKMLDTEINQYQSPKELKDIQLNMGWACIHI